MEQSYIELYKSAQKTCEACKIKPEEKVVIYTDTMKSTALIDAFFTAAVACGAEVLIVKAEGRPPMVEPPKAAVEAMAQADMIFDLATESWLFTDATQKIIKTGTRMLQVLVTEKAVRDRPPIAAVKDRVEKGYQIFDGCQEIRITSDLGTDLTVRRGGRKVVPQAGCVHTPGDWDSLGLAMVNFSPPETEAEGTVVFNGSLYLIPDHKLLVSTPIHAEVNKGRVTNIRADHTEAKLLDDWFRAWNDPNSYVIAHVGFGVDPRADIYSYDIGAWESLDGGIIVAFGSNYWVESGGQNKSLSHMDAVLFNANLQVDGKVIIDRGKFVVPELTHCNK